MTSSIRSHLLVSVAGGLVVAGAFLALGVVGKRPTQTVLYETLEAGGSLAGHGHELSAHDIYVRDAPGVVFVKALSTGPWLSPFGRSPSQRQSGSSTGSGFLIRLLGDSGLILTTYHVIEGADPLTGVTVEFDAAGPLQAVVVGANQGDDLALLRVNMAGLPSIRPLTFGDSASVKVGDPTLAIADPFGSDRTLASGIVSALQSQIETPDGFSVDNVIQTDTPALLGESGAPLLNADGRVIGIGSQILAVSEEGAGGGVEVPFAVPIDTVDQFLAATGDDRQAAVGLAGESSSATATAYVKPQRSPDGGAAPAGASRMYR
ncbi:MAG: S1C family serine protease [Solirubrobacteraceae bacterium]